MGLLGQGGAAGRLRLLAVCESSAALRFCFRGCFALGCFLATVLLPIETYLLYVYCVLVVRAWTYEYGLNQMYVGGFFTGNRPPVFP